MKLIEVLNKRSVGPTPQGDVILQPYMVENGSLLSLQLPNEVRNNFICMGNGLTSLRGCPEYVHGSFNCSNNDITNLYNIHKYVKFIGRYFIAERNPIKSNILGLLLIDGLQLIQLSEPNKGAQRIINNYLSPDAYGTTSQPRDKYDDLLKCQQELIDAGYEKLAQF